MEGLIFAILMIVVVNLLKTSKTKTKSSVKHFDSKKTESNSDRPVASRAAASSSPQVAPLPARSMMSESSTSAPEFEHAQVSVHVSAHHHDDMYAGSMNADGLEGDPDAYDTMPSAHSAELFTDVSQAPVRQDDGLKLSFSPASMASAVVMTEILERPAFRRARSAHP